MGTFLERNKWTIGVFAAIFDQEGKILLVKARGQTEWSLPGGGVKEQDAREAPIEDEVFVLALFRELHEEINLPHRAFLKISGPQFFVSCKLQDVAFVYVLQLDEEVVSTLSPQEEIEELAFFAQDQLPTLLGPRMQRMVQWAFEKYALG
jgi:8-oxo-dGTP pyrophosphatase MutT (NUDIX family)